MTSVSGGTFDSDRYRRQREWESTRGRVVVRVVVDVSVFYFTVGASRMRATGFRARPAPTVVINATQGRGRSPDRRALPVASRPDGTEPSDGFGVGLRSASARFAGTVGPAGNGNRREAPRKQTGRTTSRISTGERTAHVRKSPNLLERTSINTE